MGRHARDPYQRFWAGVERGGLNDCWLWQYSGCGKFYEYGKTTLDGKRMTAHRAAYILSYGDIPDGLEVCHTCDNGKCCNPMHLWLGTHTDNMRDKMRKGRGNHQIGEVNHAAKLTEQDVLEIREWLKQGMSQREAARRKGVSSVAISYINTRTTWRHI